MVEELKACLANFDVVGSFSLCGIPSDFSEGSILLKEEVCKAAPELFAGLNAT